MIKLNKKILCALLLVTINKSNETNLIKDIKIETTKEKKEKTIKVKITRYYSY